MLTDKGAELFSVQLVSGPVLRDVAATHKLKAGQIRLLSASCVLCRSWPGHITPAELDRKRLFTPTLRRAHVRVLVLAGYLKRGRNKAGRATLSPTTKGKLLAEYYLVELRREAGELLRG